MIYTRTFMPLFCKCLINNLTKIIVIIIRRICEATLVISSLNVEYSKYLIMLTLCVYDLRYEIDSIVTYYCCLY